MKNSRARFAVSRSRPQRRRQDEDALASVDEALGCCRNIATLGQLLAAARADILADLETGVVVHAGDMITAEALRLEALIESVSERTRVKR